MNKGFSLIELSIGMTIAAILAAAVAPLVIRSVENIATQKTAEEIGIIQKAALKFHMDRKAWPATVTDLQAQGYLNAQWDGLNPWRNPYIISTSVSTLSVSVNLPQRLTAAVAARVPMTSIDGEKIVSVIGTSFGSEGIAPGVIAAWSGTIADIPNGWALCDGNNGTPDLRDRFIVGARQDEGGIAKSNVMGVLNQTGGSTTHNHGGMSGAHALTIAEMPAHHFDIMINDATTSGGARFPETAGVHSLKPYPTNTLGADQPHSHVITSDFNLPPFYALAFIMKLP